LLKFRQFLTEGAKPAKKKAKKDEKPKLKPTKANSTMVMLFGKMNPPTHAHEKAIFQAQQHAEKLGAKLKVVVNHSDSNIANPIDPKRKLKHLKAAFPDVDISMSDPSTPTVIHHIRKANQDGIRNIVVMGGGKRAKNYEKILNGYNGREYKFETIKVQQLSHGAGHISSEELRNHAHDNNFDEFRKGLPEKIRGNFLHARTMFQDVKRGLKQKKKDK
jgi:hypothetical protein